LRFVIILLVSYLLGSIPFGYLIVTAKTGADIRETGSGGTGATNVSRRAGKVAGVITLILDALKGAGAVYFAKTMLIDLDQTTVAWWLGLVGIVAMLGHIFPVWLRFRGGKGVATGVGVFLMIAPLAIGFSGIIFLIVVLLTRYISLGSMLAAVSIPLFIWLGSWIKPVPETGALIYCSLSCAALILFAHRENIHRLLKGTESKFR
jgi:glycerol-3-phosphate acyltransferase PlsY